MGGRSKQVRNALKKSGLRQPMSIPCKKGHTHNWPVQGPITKEDIGRCQVVCQFCSVKGEYIEAKWPWHLRRHVWDMHRQDYPDLIVPPEWSGKKQYSKGKVGPTPSVKTGRKKAKTALCANGSAAATPLSNTPSWEQFVASGAITPVGELDFSNLSLLAAVPNDDFGLEAMINTAEPMDCNVPASNQLASSESGTSGSNFDYNAFIAEATTEYPEFALPASDEPAAAPIVDESSILSELFPEMKQVDPFAAVGFDQTLSLPGFTDIDFDSFVSGY